MTEQNRLTTSPEIDSKAPGPKPSDRDRHRIASSSLSRKLSYGARNSQFCGATIASVHSRRRSCDIASSIRRREIRLRVGSDNRSQSSRSSRRLLAPARGTARSSRQACSSRAEQVAPPARSQLHQRQARPSRDRQPRGRAPSRAALRPRPTGRRRTTPARRPRSRPRGGDR